MIYFAQALAIGYIKIGFTRSPVKRLAQLKDSSYEDTKMLATMSGGFKLEKSLHTKFADCRVFGEWFQPTPELLDYIKTVAIPFDSETAVAEEKLSISDYLPSKVRNELALLGERIRLARFRRKLTLDMLAERAGISRPTLTAIEQGNPGASIGKYASVLFCLDLYSSLGSVAEKDDLGRLLQDAEVGQRVRPKREIAI